MTAPRLGFLARHATLLLGILILLPIVICGTLASWWFARQAIASQQVDEMRAEIRGRGLPINDKTLTEFRSRQMGRDQSDRWTTLLKQVESEEFVSSYAGLPIVDMKVELPDFRPGESYQSDEKVRDFFQQWSGTMQGIHEVTVSKTRSPSFGALNQNCPATLPLPRQWIWRR